MNCKSYIVPERVRNPDLRLRSPGSWALSTTQCCPEKSHFQLSKQHQSEGPRAAAGANVKLADPDISWLCTSAVLYPPSLSRPAWVSAPPADLAPPELWAHSHAGG